MINEQVLPAQRDVQFYEEQGYWVSGKILDDDRIADLIEAMDRVLREEYETGQEPWTRSWYPGDDPKALCKIDNSQWADLTLRSLALDETIGAIAARLAKTSEIRLWHDQLLFKPGQGAEAAAGANVGWHQDRNYWKCSCDEMLTAWVALVDVSVANGCMQVVPGSHRWGEIEGDFFAQDMDQAKLSVEERTGHEFKTVPLEMKSGQVSFHHCLTIHGSGPNMTDSPRRSMAIHLMPEHAAYVAGTSSDDHMSCILMRRAGGKPGDLFRGGHWPVLCPRTPENALVTAGPSHRELVALQGAGDPRR